MCKKVLSAGLPFKIFKSSLAHKSKPAEHSLYLQELGQSK